MRNRGMVFIAILIIGLGVVLLLGNLFDINFGAFCFPLGLILIGLFVLLRPRTVEPGTTSRTVLLGDFEQAGPGELSAEEYFGFIVDAKYDLTKLDIPPGETVIKGFSFIGEVEIFAPADIGVEINGSSFVTEFKQAGEEEQSYFLSPLNWKSDGYKMMEKRVRFDLTQFIGDIKLRWF